MAPLPDIKENVLGDLLGSVKKTATSALGSAQSFTSQLATRGGGVTDSGLPSWLLPLALVIAVGTVVIKFVLPKIKGFGKSSPIKFGSRVGRK